MVAPSLQTKSAYSRESFTTALAGKRVAVGAIGGAQGGPRTYAQGILTQLIRRRCDLQQLCILSDCPGYFMPERHPDWVMGLRVRSLHPALRPVTESWQVRRLLRGHGVHLYHGTKNFLPSRLPCPAVVTIHDLAPFLHPDSFSNLSGRFLRWATRTACQRAERVIAVSQATARDLQEVLDISPEKIDVVYNGVSPEFLQPVNPAAVRTLRQRLNLEGPVILSLGTIQPRKHQLEVLQAFRLVEERLPPQTTCLFVGRRGWKTRAFEEALADCDSSRVRWIRNFPNRDLRALYGLASIYVSPGECEGFGLATVEAMAQGVPIVALHDGATPEVVDNSAMLVPEPDPEILAEGMLSLMEDRDLRNEAASAGRSRAAEFTWTQSAAGHVQTYARVLSATKL